MSKKKKTTKADRVVDNTSEDAGFKQLEDDGVGDPAGEFVVEPLMTDSRGSRSAGIVSWSALLISLLAVAAVAVNFLTDRSSVGDADDNSAELQALVSTLGTTQDVITSLEQNMAALTEQSSARDARINSIGRQLDDRLRQLESLPGRLAAVETSMASIQGISTGARDAWLLAEAEYYMQIANAQLQLANNPELARVALAHADERILQLADPRLINIRQALSDELRALEVIDSPDTAGTSLTLASLARIVDSLPLRQETLEREQHTTQIDAELSGVDRAIVSFKNAVSGVVSVRRTDEAMQPLIAPEARYFLRANLALQLQAARLALLRGEESIFRQSLDDADAWLSEYYVADSAGVQSARASIAEIRDSTLSVALPDISLSLRLLRQFNRLASAAEADVRLDDNTDTGGVEQQL